MTPEQREVIRLALDCARTYLDRALEDASPKCHASITSAIGEIELVRVLTGGNKP